MDEIKGTFTKVIAIIESAKKNAYRKVNEELINMYWRVGQFISEEVKTASYGDSFIDELSRYIQDTFPGIKGFNRRGLYRIQSRWPCKNPRRMSLRTYGWYFSRLI